MATYTNPGRRIPLESSNLHSLAYDTSLDEDGGTLDVWFHRLGYLSDHYRYFGVSADIVCHILFSESQGGAFAEFKKLGLSYQRVAD